MPHRNMVGSLRRAVRVTEGRSVGLGDDDILFGPKFLYKDGLLTSPTLDYFAIYALQAAYRRVLVGTNFMSAGVAVFERGLHAPAVSLFYTAAYHAAGGLAALSGRVWNNLSEFARKDSGIDKDVIVATLTEGNRWTLEGVRNRNHLTWWLQLRDPLRDLDHPAPDYFQALLNYFMPPTRSNMPLEDALAGVEPGPWKHAALHDNVDWLLRRLAETRHVAHYEGLGVDPEYVDAMMNGDVGSGQEHKQAQAIGEFAAGALHDAGRMILRLRESVPLPEDLRRVLGIGLLFPAFDWPEPDDVPIDDLRDVVRALLGHLR